jgi:DNA-binding response OmpR family regulator
MPASDIKALPKVAVLCIDDDISLLQCEKAFLETFGYTAVTASSGREGLELASAHSFDVVVVDYFMPEMDGQELAIAMRRRWPQTPIIMLSGIEDVPTQVLNAVDAFVVKDCLASELLPAITLLREKQLVHNRRLVKRGDSDPIWQRPKLVPWSRC